ncbi:hypothetical protein CJI97_000388 [Candidozyma auris]|nr:hypothetical protein CJI97_000388 [[Candida] auris]QWW23218.1 hypothetical protein CA7LBN_002019 [[Candida] auris]
MGLPSEDHLHEEVPFDEDESLHQNINPYHHNDMAALEGSASLLSQNPSSTSLSSAASTFNNTSSSKYPPHLSRRLPKALSQPQFPHFHQPPAMTVQGLPQSSNQDQVLDRHDNTLHSPLTSEQLPPPTSHGHQHSLPHDSNANVSHFQQPQLSGMRGPYSGKSASVSHLQQPHLSYQVSPQGPMQVQNPVASSAHPHLQYLNVASVPSQFTQQIPASQSSAQYYQPLSSSLPLQSSQHQYPQVVSTSYPVQAQTSQQPQLVNPLPQQFSPHMQQMEPQYHGMPNYSETSSSKGVQRSDDEVYDIGKPKVAPRSVDLFRVGPPFSETVQHLPLYRSEDHQSVIPRIKARIDRGFELSSSGLWIGYKRNYFTLVASYDLGIDLDTFADSRFYTLRPSNVGNEQLNIKYFALNIEAKCSGSDTQVRLVQHTPKRDKGPQNPPAMYPAIPGELPDHQTVKESCNKRNGSKLESMNKIFNFDRKDYWKQRGLQEGNPASILSSYPSNIAKVARFERIQFTKSIRTKVKKSHNKYFTLHAELVAVVTDNNQEEYEVVVASSSTAGLLVRGRSPSKYQSDRTSGYRGPSDSENQSM